MNQGIQRTPRRVAIRIARSSLALRLLALTTSLLAFASADPARAEPVVWEIDEARSTIHLEIPDAEVEFDGFPGILRLRNQFDQPDGPWDDGDTASLAGTILSELDEGVSIAFVSAEQDIEALDSGEYRPNPAVFNPNDTNFENPDGQYGDGSTAPAAFGTLVRASSGITGATRDGAYQSFSDVRFDVESGGPVALSDDSFDASALTVGILSMTTDYDGLTTPIGQPFPDQVGAAVPSALGDNGATTGTITTPDPEGSPDTRELTIPIDVDVVLDLQGILLDATISGQIVAVAVPEPAAHLALVAALASLFALRRTRADKVLPLEGARTH